MIEGIYKVHDKMVLEQLGFKRATDRLFLSLVVLQPAVLKQCSYSQLLLNMERESTAILKSIGYLLRKGGLYHRVHLHRHFSAVKLPIISTSLPQLILVTSFKVLGLDALRTRS